MRSIAELKKELAIVTAQGKDHRRSAMIQAMRTRLREQVRTFGYYFHTRNTKVTAPKYTYLLCFTGLLSNDCKFAIRPLIAKRIVVRDSSLFFYIAIEYGRSHPHY